MTEQEQIDYLYKNYGFQFPMKAKYKRSPNRIYFATDFKDGEEIKFSWMCDHPSSNVVGNATYSNGHNFHLINIKELEAI